MQRLGETLDAPVPSSDPEAVKRDVDRLGVGIHKDFLDETFRRELLERVLEQAELERKQGVAELSSTGTASEAGFASPDAPPAPFQSVSLLPNKGKVFRDAFMDERLQDYARHILRGVPYYVTQQAATIVRKGAAGQVIHVDQQAWPFLTPVPVLFNVILCLTEIEPDMGSTRFVPGSQNGPPPVIGMDPFSGRVGNLDEVTTIASSAPAGSAVIFEGRVWHGQGPSVSDKDRVVIITTYAMHMVRPQDIYSAGLQDEVYAQLSDAEKDMLGFTVHFEYAGRIAPRHAGDERRNLNFSYPFVPELRRGSEARAVAAAHQRIGHAERQASIIDQA
jgi:ectoine hydroxylase-related dioxygenase (phytanoyl-CoA dioxygenase family)